EGLVHSPAAGEQVREAVTVVVRQLRTEAGGVSAAMDAGARDAVVEPDRLTEARRPLRADVLVDAETASRSLVLLDPGGVRALSDEQVGLAIAVKVAQAQVRVVVLDDSVLVEPDVDGHAAGPDRERTREATLLLRPTHWQRGRQNAEKDEDCV